MRILITGGTGYLGARLAYFLSLRGNEVFVLDSQIPDENDDWKSAIKDCIIGDIRDEKVLNQLCDLRLDNVIHTISLDHNASQQMKFSHVSSINVTPTYELLNVLTKCNLKRFLYFSTQQVYGRTLVKNISEETPAAPINIYGLTHLLSENICSYYNRNSHVRCLNIRLSNSYGPPIFKSNNCWWLVINDFCKTAFKDKQIRILSDGKPQRDFINIQDLCSGIEILLETSVEKINHDVYNIGSGETLSILELALIITKVFRELYNIEIPILFADGTKLDIDFRAEKIDRFFYSTQKLQELGFKVNIKIEKGIVEIFKYLENNAQF